MDNVIQQQFDNATMLTSFQIGYAFTNDETRLVYQDAAFKKIDNADLAVLETIAPDVNYQTLGAVGIDLYLPDTFILKAGFVTKVDLGIAWDIPIGIAGLIIPRSSNGKQEFQVVLSNGTGLIDSDYKGTLWAQFTTLSDETITINKGERFAQIFFIPYIKAVPTELDWEVFKNSTARGTLGIGEATGSQA